MKQSINQRAAEEEKEDDDIVAQLENDLGQQLEVALEKFFLTEQIVPIISIQRSLVEINKDIDKKLINKYFRPMDTKSQGKIQMQELINNLKNVNGKFDRQAVLYEIADNLESPVQDSLEQKGLDLFDKTASEFHEWLNQICNISKFSAACLFFDLLASENDDTVDISTFVDELEEAKDKSGKVSKSLNAQQTKVVDKPGAKIVQKKKPISVSSSKPNDDTEN